MDEQKTYSVEELQDHYLQALNSGDVDKIREASERIDAQINSANNQQVNPPIEQVHQDAEENVSEAPLQESIKESEAVAQQPQVAKDGDPAPQQEMTQQQQEAQDWLSSLDPNIRKNVEELIGANKKLEHRISADNGRVAAYQRRYEELQKKAVQQEDLIKNLRASTTAQPQSSSAATKQPTSTFSIDDDPDLKAIAEMDEPLARVIARREQFLKQQLEQQEAKFRQLEERISPVVKSQEDMYVKNELDRLTKYVPNAIEIFNYRDPETQVNYWEDWVNRQPPRMKELAESDNAEEVAQALRLHIMEMQAYFGYDNQQQQQPAGEPVTTQQPAKTPVDPNLAAKVQGERERKLSAQPVGSASVRPPQQAKPTLEQIMADPELLAKYQDEIYKEELKKKYSNQ